MIGENSVHEVAKITSAVVKEAALSMKPSKEDVSGGFCSNAILNSPDILFEQCGNNSLGQGSLILFPKSSVLEVSTYLIYRRLTIILSLKQDNFTK